MKTLITLLTATIGLTAFSFQASASPGYLSCANEPAGEMTDGYFQIDILEDGIEFFPYEGHFVVDASEMVYDSGTYVINKVTVQTTTEGEEGTATVDGVLMLYADDTKLFVLLSMDEGPAMSYQMDCVQK